MKRTADKLCSARRRVMKNPDRKRKGSLLPGFKPVKPEDAATVLLVRDEGSGLEVYMTRRRPELMFLGGYHVFPGGKLDAADRGESLAGRCRGLSPSQVCSALSGVEDPDRARGFFTAAARELFEEAGVLLCEDGQGRARERFSEKQADRLSSLRLELLEDRIGLAEVLEAEDMFLSLSRLHWFAHWVTPAFSPRRFNTYFFAARKPSGQEPSPFRAEVAEGGWTRPEEALERWRAGEWRMIPPTIASLDTLSRYSNWAELKADFSLPPAEHARTVWRGVL